jgi:hypothetical protein
LLACAKVVDYSAYTSADSRRSDTRKGKKEADGTRDYTIRGFATRALENIARRGARAPPAGTLRMIPIEQMEGEQAMKLVKVYLILFRRPISPQDYAANVLDRL